MANATNGPVDPAAGTGRSAAERARAEAAMLAGLSPDPAERESTAEPVGRHRAVPATATKSMITIPAEPARKSVRNGAAAEEAGPALVKPPAVKSTSSRPPAAPPAVAQAPAGRASAGQAARRAVAKAPAAEEKPAATRRRTTPAETTADKPARRRPAAADPDVEPAAEPAKPARRATRSAKPADAATTAKPAAAKPAATRAKKTVADGATTAKRTPGGAAPAKRAPAEAAPAKMAPAEAAPDAAAPARATRKPTVAKPQAAPAPIPASTPEPAGELMARGIVELAAERLAASATPPAPEPEPDDNPTAAAIARAAMPPVRRATRSASRLPLTSTPAAYPDAGGRDAYPDPVAYSDTDALSVADHYPQTANRPAGLPASVRLPVGLPDNLWPPPGLLERHATENLYVPGPTAVPPPPLEEEEPEAATEELPDARVYVPAPTAERQPAPEPDFLPSVLARDDDTTSAPVRSAKPGARMVRRRRRAMLLAYLVLITLVLVAGHQLRSEEQPLAPGRDAAQPAAEPAGVGPAENVPAATPQAEQTQAAETPAAEEPAQAGEFRYAKGRGPMLGTAGKLYRFKVAVEKTVDETDFAEKIDDTLGDERSWINDGRLRLRRVANSAGNADFTVYLASPATSEKMCATGGLATEGFTSCRVPGKVIINAERWSDGVSDYEGHLDEYRRYMINHEVGHELGHGHETCPGDGEKAPVMMQQTYGLKGCTRNSWPYLDGKRYAGAPVA